MITPVDHTARIIELLPKAEAIRVENCGHLGLIEKHEVFNDALDRLLARVRAELRRTATDLTSQHWRQGFVPDHCRLLVFNLLRLLSASGPPAPRENVGRSEVRPSHHD